MFDAVLLLGGIATAGAIPSAAVLALRGADRTRWLTELETYRLSFPRDLDSKDVGAFLNGLSGLLPTAGRRPITVRGLGIDIVADQSGISHYLHLPRSQAEIVLSGLRGALPGVGIVRDPEYVSVRPTLAGELVTSRPHHQLQVGHPEATSNALLAALQPLSAGEHLIISYLIFPEGFSQPPQGDGSSGLIGQLVVGTPSNAKPSRAIEDKYAHPQFGVVARIGAASQSKARDRQLLGRLTSAFHASNSRHATLRRQQVSSRSTVKGLITRHSPLLGYPCRLNSLELVGLLAFPVGDGSLAGLTLGNARILAPSAATLRQGRIVAYSNYPGMADRPLAVSVRAAQMHTHILGPSGVGKSVLLLNLFAQDVAAGFGAILLDPKDDLAEAALDHVPHDREVIFINPSDDRPVGINLFAGGDTDPELVTEQLTSVMHRLWASSWGPRTDHVLRHALLSLVQFPGASFTELPLLLTNADFRRQVVSRIDDPISLGPFWAEMDTMSMSERSAAVAPLLNKLGAIVARPRLRRVLGQSGSQVDFDDILAQRKVLIVQLSAGKLGEDAAALLGSFVLQKTWAAVQRRIRLPQSERHPVFIHIDEFQRMTNLASPLPQVLAESRAMGVGMTLANQHLGQLDRETRDALANCRTRITFQTSSTDAKALAPLFAPYLGPQDLQGLGAYQIAAILAGDGASLPPVTGQTRPEPTRLGHGLEHRRRSREHYGQDAAQIDAELRQRQAALRASGPVGRQRRSQ